MSDLTPFTADATPDDLSGADPAPLARAPLDAPPPASAVSGLAAPELPPVAPRYPLRQVVAAIALFYALLAGFDARGLYHWAKKLPVTERSAALKKATESLWAVTAAVGLEAPEIALETAFLDFQGADTRLYPKTYAELAVRRAAKEAHRQPEATDTPRRLAASSDKPAPPTLAAKTPRAPQKAGRHGAPQKPQVLIIGDSIMVSVGPVIKKALGDKLASDAVVKARVATGLARPDVYDWNAELRRSIAAARFDYVLLMLGTNDSQDFVVDGEILTYGTTPWFRAYTDRIGAMMDLACGSGGAPPADAGGSDAKRVLWIGLPPMQSAAFNRKAVRINSWAKRQAAARGCVEFVSLDDALGDGKGGFASYLKIDRALEKVRMVDGIHITAKGGRLVADAVIDRLRRLTHRQAAAPGKAGQVAASGGGSGARGAGVRASGGDAVAPENAALSR